MKNTIETTRDWRVYWARAVQNVGAADLFRQVGRTVTGQPEPEQQIGILVRAIAERLKLNKNDVLLDLCCGNGLVTFRLSAMCRTIVGVDYSNDLVEIAKNTNPAANIAYIRRYVEDLLPFDLPPWG